VRLEWVEKGGTMTTNNGFGVNQLAEGLWAIDEGMVCCFLICGEDRALLIDSCISTGTALSELVKTLTDKPVELVFTHSDRDHTGGQDGFGTALLHPSEFQNYFSKGNEDRLVKTVWEGDLIDLGGRNLEVVLVPGHTPGSIALLEREEGWLFSGDVFSDYWIHLFGAGRSLVAFIESLKKLESMSDSYDVIHACHGSSTLGKEWVSKTIRAAEKLLAGELEGKDPPRAMPCKAYSHEGVTLLY